MTGFEVAHVQVRDVAPICEGFVFMYGQIWFCVLLARSNLHCDAAVLVIALGPAAVR